MSRSQLSPEQAERAEQPFQSSRQATEADLRGLAERLACEEDSQLRGPAEFEVRDRVHQIGAKAIGTALDRREKDRMKAGAVRKADPGERHARPLPGGDRRDRDPQGDRPRLGLHAPTR